MIAPLSLIGEGTWQPTSLLVWALLLGAAALGLRLMPAAKPLRYPAALLGLAAVGMMLTALPRIGVPLDQAVFWLLAGVTLISAGISITSRSPVYMAVWFALSLLGTAGMFLFQGAQFLGVATLVVYAGAIVVVFLFLLMMAQPMGETEYDRSSWSPFAVPMAVTGAALWIGLIASSAASITSTVEPNAVEPNAVEPPRIAASEHHMAHFGAELFARHLISVEVAGTLLLAALVGAIAIVIQGRTAPAPEPNTGSTQSATPESTATESTATESTATESTATDGATETPPVPGETEEKASE